MVELEMKYSRFVYSINKNVKSGIEFMSVQNLNIKKRHLQSPRNNFKLFVWINEVRQEVIEEMLAVAQIIEFINRSNSD